MIENIDYPKFRNCRIHSLCMMAWNPWKGKWCNVCRELKLAGHSHDRCALKIETLAGNSTKTRDRVDCLWNSESSGAGDDRCFLRLLFNKISRCRSFYFKFFHRWQTAAHFVRMAEMHIYIYIPGILTNLIKWNNLLLMHWIFIFLLETLEHIFSFFFHMECQNLKAECWPCFN